MSFVFALVVLMIVSRHLRRRRWWGQQEMMMWRGRGSGPRWVRHAERAGMISRPAPEPVPQKRESAFEVLKKRYVAGELNDEQYEREVDALLQTPEGRAQLQ